MDIVRTLQDMYMCLEAMHEVKFTFSLQSTESTEWSYKRIIEEIDADIFHLGREIFQREQALHKRINPEIYTRECK